MTQIKERIIELTSWLNLKDLQKLPSYDRKIAKLALEMKLPQTLDEKKLSLVEAHLQQIHLQNPTLKRLNIVKERVFSHDELLKKKSNSFCARFSRAIKNLFGRVSSKNLLAIYHKKYAFRQAGPLHLGKHYERAQDYTQALHYYQIASENENSPDLEAKISHWYSIGKGTESDHDQAYHWHIKSMAHRENISVQDLEKTFTLPNF